MSLENQIANLVGAANNLTGEVAGKMRDIDRKVDQATQAVPDAIRRMASMTRYVNYETGSDTGGDGSSIKPFRTILHAVKQAVSGSHIIIVLRGNADHICEVQSDHTHHNAFHNKTVEIGGDRTKYDSGAPSVLRFRATPWARNQSICRCNFFEGGNISVAFNQCNIVTENKTGLPYYNGDFGGVFTRGTTIGGTTNFNIFSLNCNFYMEGNLQFVTAYSGSLGIFATSTRFHGGTETPSELISGKLIKSIALNNAGLRNFGTKNLGEVFGFDPATVSTSSVLT